MFNSNNHKTIWEHTISDEQFKSKVFLLFFFAQIYLKSRNSEVGKIVILRIGKSLVYSFWIICATVFWQHNIDSKCCLPSCCRQYIALNVYVALCYYKLDYFDVSQEVLASYLQKFPDSATALNLKACNYYKLENGKAAENEIRSLMVNINAILLQLVTPFFSFC